jgi:F0F1-type ATP synthase assembly protein I
MPPGDDQPSQPNRSQYALNLTLASVAGQVGCLTLVIVVAALFGGLWLDRALQTRPLFTIVLVIGSMPVSLFIMYRVAMSAVARIRPAGPAGARGKEGAPVDHDS